MTEKQKRRAMAPVTETARQWAEALRAEVEQWPGVRVQRSFGMMLVYRGEVVFAALPLTRALHAEDAIMLKFQRETAGVAKRMAGDGRFAAAGPGAAGKRKGESRKWRFFLLRSDGDVHGAIEWLAEAYTMAKEREDRSPGRSRRKSKDMPKG